MVAAPVRVFSPSDGPMVHLVLELVAGERTFCERYLVGSHHLRGTSKRATCPTCVYERVGRIQGEMRFYREQAHTCEHYPELERLAILHGAQLMFTPEEPLEVLKALKEVVELFDVLWAAKEHYGYIATLALKHSVCPLHRRDYAICFTTNDPECSQIRRIHPEYAERVDR